jgi:NAD-dependent deacetylase
MSRDLKDSASMDSLLQEAAGLIRASDWITAFTGAGMSVESGIPPFRGENGIWNTCDPRLLELPYFTANPEKCWIAIKEIFYDFFGRAQPNPGHLALAEMEKNGLLKTLITQNIDDLHHRAGSRRVVEFHGNSRLLLCRSCGRTFEAAAADLSRLPPLCRDCGEVLKPDFVFFGEAIPFTALSESRAAAGRTDCMLVIGTTGEVYPAAALPRTAAENGAHIIEINPAPSNYTDSVTTVYIPLPAGQALPRILELLGRP